MPRFKKDEAVAEDEVSDALIEVGIVEGEKHDIFVSIGSYKGGPLTLRLNRMQPEKGDTYSLKALGSIKSPQEARDLCVMLNTAADRFEAELKKAAKKK
jgi:hypothetical protein